LTPGGTDAFNLGVDFQGGTVVTAKFKQKPSADDLRAALNNAGVGDPIIQDSTDKTDETLIKVPLIEQAPQEGVDTATAEANQVNQGRQIVKNALDTFGKEADPTLNLDQDEAATYKIVGTESVSPIAGAQLRDAAVIATLLAMVGILLFIAFRYDWTYAAGAVVAVFHDVLVTLAFFSLFQWDISMTVLAALLTLVGFSVNDSIVIFDRIRENLTLHRNESLYKLTNDSINQTMSRTIVTNGLVFLSVLALVLFGGEVLRGFSLALFVGSITGTYSTIAIASPIAIWWQSKLGRAEMKDVVSKDVTSEKLASAARRSVTRRPVTR
jgi:preprotein translocase subunit SecF